MKGDLNDECNRTVCHRSPANWYNHSTRKHYCYECALILNRENERDAMRLFGHALCTIVEPKEEESQEEWISVKDRLPEPDVNVLCYSRADYIEGYYCSTSKIFKPEIEDAGYMNNDNEMVIDVSHWMPLPSPPKD
jgi:hypothetical protein